MPQPFNGNTDTRARPPNVTLDDLQLAWQGVVQRAKLVVHHRIERAQISIRDCMTRVLRALADRPFITSDELFDPVPNLSVAVVTFAGPAPDPARAANGLDHAGRAFCTDLPAPRCSRTMKLHADVDLRALNTFGVTALAFSTRRARARGSTPRYPTMAR